MARPFFLMAICVVLGTHRATPAIGNVFWANEQAGVIYNASLDGSNATSVIASLNHPWDIVVDQSSQMLYWTESIGDRIARRSLAGGNVETILPIDDPEELAIDFGAAKMYWAWGILGLHGANLDGTGVTLLAGGGRVITGVAVDPANQLVYYADHFGNRIGRVPGGGGATDFFLSGLPGPPLAVAVDEANSMVYWSDGNEDIWRASLIDGTGRTLLYSDVGYSRDFFLDEGRDLLWWTWEEGPVGLPPYGGISSAPLGGGGPVTTVGVGFRPVGIWVTEVPEPNTGVLLGIALCTVGIRRQFASRSGPRKRRLPFAAASVGRGCH